MMNRLRAAVPGLALAVLAAGALTLTTALPASADKPQTEAEKKGWEIAR